MRSDRQTISRAGMCYLLFLIVVQGVQIGAMLLFPFFASGGWGLWLLAAVPMYAAGLPALLLLGRALLPHGGAPARGAALSPARWAAWFVVVLGATYLLNFLSVGITSLLALLKGRAVANPLALMTGGGELLPTLLFGCVVAGLGEEFIFRKLLYRYIGGLGARTYIWLGGLIFGLFHLNLSQFFYAFALGALFCAIYAKTGCIWYTVALHIAVNLCGMVLLPGLAVSGSEVLAAVSVGIIFVAIAAGTVLFFRLRKTIAPAPPAEQDAHPVRAALTSPGTLLYILTCAAIIGVVTFLS